MANSREVIIARIETESRCLGSFLPKNICITKNNIKEIDCLNKKLDPNLHQAMMEIEDDNKEPGTIIQEIQKGFMLKDRLLRPTLVLSLIHI